MSELISKSVDDIIDIKRGYAFRSEDYETFGVPILRVTNIEESGHINNKFIFLRNELASKYENFLVEDNDILLVMVGATTGKLGFVSSENVPALLNQNIWNLKPKSNIDKEYLRYKIAEIIESYLAVAQGSARDFLKQGDFEKFQVTIHSDKKKQQEIAKILRCVDNQIDTTQVLIDKYTHIKQGMMADLFSRGIDTSTGQLRPSFEEAPELYHKTDLGWLPKDWSVLPLSELSSIASGITMGKDLTGVKTVTVPYLRVANVQDGYLDLSEVKTVKVPAEDADKYVLQYGDVLMNEGGDFDKLGRGTVWRNEIDECSHQNHVFRVRVQESKLLSEYLAYWSASSFGKRYFILNSKQSTNLASINSTQLKAFPIATPNCVEQLEIENRLKSVDNMISSYKDELNKQSLQKQGLMQDLLTGKVSVA